MKIGLLGRLRDDQIGATAVEYGLIVALIFIAIVATVNSVADQTGIMWTKVSTSVAAATNPGP